MNKVNHIITKTAQAGKTLLTAVLLFTAANLCAQNMQTLKGRILDTEGKPVAGAIINVAEESRIALSDEDGYFSLKT